MSALRLALIASLLSACWIPEKRPEYPQVVGPPLGESTAMGPSDSSRNIASNLSPSGVPRDVGPGKAITPPPPGAPAPTTVPSAIDAAEGVIVLPLEQQPPPPVFTPPPPPPPPDLSDRVMADGAYGEG